MQSEPAPSTLGRVVRAFVRTLLGIAAVFALWIAVGFTYTDRMWAKADRAWAKLNRTDAELRARFPTEFTNSAGFALDAAARKLGVPLVIGASFVSVRPESGVVLADDYIQAALEVPGGPIPAPSPELTAAYSELRDRIETLIRVLNGDPAPRFTASLEPAPNPAEINVVRYRMLHNVLLCEALQQERRGDSIAAALALNAAWRLIDLADARGDFTGTVLGSYSYADVATTLRFLSEPRLEWRRRLDEIDSRSRIRDTYQADVHQQRSHFWNFPLDPDASTAYGDEINRQELGLVGQTIGFMLFAPIERYDAALMSEWHAGVLGAWMATPPCSPLPEDPPAPTWPAQRVTGFATMWSASPAAVIRQSVADRIQLRIELTRKVIEARESLARLGHFEVPEAGSSASYCPGERWLYELSPDGDLTIRFSGSEAALAGERLKRLPLAFRIPASG